MDNIRIIFRSMFIYYSHCIWMRTLYLHFMRIAQTICVWYSDCSYDYLHAKTYSTARSQCYPVCRLWSLYRRWGTCCLCCLSSKSFFLFFPSSFFLEIFPVLFSFLLQLFHSCLHLLVIFPSCFYLWVIFSCKRKRGKC